jgi:hypothetical protein
VTGGRDGRDEEDDTRRRSDGFSCFAFSNDDDDEK